jgi:hypothetical protein
MGRACSTNEKRNIQFNGGKAKGMRPLGIPKHWCVDNIKMDIDEIGRGKMDWIDLTKDINWWKADENMVMNLRVPSNAGKFL